VGPSGPALFLATRSTVCFWALRSLVRTLRYYKQAALATQQSMQAGVQAGQQAMEAATQAGQQGAEATNQSAEQGAWGAEQVGNQAAQETRRSSRSFG
jgi:hypothetical protein